MNDMLSAMNSKHISSIQRGFVRGRQPLQNVVDLDYFAHAYALDALEQNKRPIMLFLDVAAAFPSLAHDWIIMVLMQLGAPAGFL
eukprot:6675717-Alexandrium_andersonii.AAC.1